jgi:peptidoglycan/xylan/chitin deacetylase (PgdA/CDA1 family)
MFTFMFLKRSIVLVVGVLLFIATLIVYSYVSHAQMEQRFADERQKYNVEGVILTTSEPATPAPTPTPAPATTAAASDTNSAPDTNNIVTPVPSPGDMPAGTSPAPATNAPTPDPNAAPAPMPAPSTRNDPAMQPSRFFVRASYRPLGLEMQLANAAIGAITAPNAPPSAIPATNSAAPITGPAIPPATSESPAASPVTDAHSKSMEGSVIVLLYHQFKAPGVAIPSKYQWTLNQDVFASEMKYIHDNGYHVVSLADVIRFLKHEITLPPASVCITIDDGYKSAIVYAAPILKQYGYPWTFFIYPEFITVSEGSGAASWNDLLALQAQGVDIESHSMTHPKLNSLLHKFNGSVHRLSPEEYDQWLTIETAGSKAILEQKMGKRITCFAYPFGEYNSQVEAKVIAAGYEAILTVAGNPVHSSTSLLSIGRYTITQSEVKHFESDLRDGALGLGDANPAPGAIVTNPRPVISAVLGFAGTLDPKSIEASVYGFDVRHDFDPKTNTLRLYLASDLIQQTVPVKILVKDAASGQTMVARWRFEYQPSDAPAHAPIAPTTNSPSAGKNTDASSKPVETPVAHAPAGSPEPMEKGAAGTPLEPGSQTAPPQ